MQAETALPVQSSNARNATTPEPGSATRHTYGAIIEWDEERRYSLPQWYR